MRNDHRGLQTFCAAARTLSFSKAAGELFITPSAVSHQIAELESRLDTKLFNRNTRGIALTHEGRELLRAIEPHLHAIDDATDRLRKEGSKQIVVVEVPESFAIEMMTSVSENFSSQNNQIELQLHMVGTLTKDELQPDVSIVYDHKPPQVSESARLFSVSYLPVCSPALLDEWQEAGVNRAEAVNNSTLLLHKPVSKTGQLCANLPGGSDSNVRNIIYFESIFALVRAAEKRMGIAIIPLPVSQYWLDSKSLVPLNNDPLVSEDSYWIFLHGGARCQRSARTFYRWMLDEFAFHC